MRYYHYIAAGVAFLAVVIGSWFLPNWWAMVVLAAGWMLAFWVGNERWRAKDRDQKGPAGEEDRWRLTWRGAAAVLTGIVLVIIAWQVVGLLDHSASGVKTYKDSKYDFSFQYPASWKTGSNDLALPGDRVSVYDPAGAKLGDRYVDSIRVTVAEVGAASAQQPTDTEVKDMLDQLKATGAADAREAVPLSRQVIGETNWWTWAFSLTQESVPVTIQLYWLFSGGLSYTVAFKAADDHWQTDKAVFDAVLTSFTVGPS